MTLVITKQADRLGLVTNDLFNGNSLFHIDRVDQGSQFVDSIKRFGIETIRWPGGAISETLFDPANPDTPLAVPRRGAPVDTSGYMKFSEIMSYGEQTGHPITLVLPTIHLLKSNGTIDMAAVGQIKAFVKAALTPGGAYADAQIEAFELGNENWSWFTGAEYGRVANVLIKAVNAAIAETGTTQDPKVLVQVADAWGPEFSPGGIYADKGWSWPTRLKQVNQDLIDQLDGVARAGIDGLIDHFYTDIEHELGASNINTLETRQKVWADNGMTLPQHITEWNVKGSNYPADLDRFAAGGGLIETFESLVRMGAETAYIWPVNQGTPNDLAGNAGAGHLSASGAAYKLLSENVRGLRLAETSIEDSDKMESSLFLNDRKAVLFVSAEGTAFSDTINLSDLIPENPGGGAVLRITETKIVREASEDAYVGNGSGAKIIVDQTGSGMAAASGWQVSLGKYETAMIKAEWVPQSLIKSGAAVVNGTSASETIYGTAASQKFAAGLGDDAVYGGGGNDTIDGGDGHDHLAGGAGADSVLGQAGNDWIQTGDGNDLIFGHAGNDRINAGADNDMVSGGAGNDSVIGDSGNDLIYGEENNDVLVGGEGNDTMHGGTGSDVLYGMEGNDVIRGVGVRATGAAFADDNVADTLVGGSGFDTLYGGGGKDLLRFGTGIVNGGSGEDFAFGGAGADVFEFSGSSGWTGIMDFQDGVDKISLSGPGISSMADLTLTQKTDVDGSKFVVMRYDDANGSGTVRIDAAAGNVLISQITDADFIF